jgi:hypothetical protein
VEPPLTHYAGPASVPGAEHGRLGPPTTPPTEAPRDNDPAPISFNPLHENRLRGEVADRLVLAARRYARVRADRRWAGEHDLGPHFVIFFYREPGPSDAFDLLRVATRIDKEGDDVADLHAIVSQLHALAMEYVSMGRFDPRVQLANRVEQMSADVRYVGLGVGTLDPSDISVDVPPLPDLRPFRGIAALHDGTKLLTHWKGGVDTPVTLANRSMNVGAWATRMWSWGGPRFLEDDGSEVGRVGSAVLAMHEYLMRDHLLRVSGRRASQQSAVGSTGTADHLLSQGR